MEKFVLNIESKEQIIAYGKGTRLSHYEPAIFAEILAAAENGDAATLAWFAGFGDSFRSTLMNVYAYRKGLAFGFTEIAFDQYGWFKKPQFLQLEELIFGNEKRYGEHSVLKVGKGKSNVWTNALSYSFGVAGGGCGLSVYGKQFSSRQDALNAGILELKALMTAKTGDTDRTNYNSQVIRGTLNAIEQYAIDSVQLKLF